jgi:hypothetical protein
MWAHTLPVREHVLFKNRAQDPRIFSFSGTLHVQEVLDDVNEGGAGDQVEVSSISFGQNSQKIFESGQIEFFINDYTHYRIKLHT